MANTDITPAMNTQTINPNPALASLADIVEPEFSHSFGLAPIYWLLILGGLTALVFSVYKLIQRHHYWLAKRQALAQLNQLEQQPNAGQQINQLLKRVLQHYQPNHPALSANTEQWQLWLAKHSSQALPNLNQLLYSKTSSETELNQFYIFAKHWLKQYQGQDSDVLPSAASASSVAASDKKEQQHA
ncbi:DUF4381 domain-containing protein [Rheinheimera sp. WS51]|uniref:DUF4381 domain-containing protein n=1 Tax=Rheinheimera sp. WS51 TaxID=3425886 RepID=UPI003D938D98